MSTTNTAPTYTPEILETTSAWPFTEARRVMEHVESKRKAGRPDKGYVLFETGYGPSGLPHIGTFGEVFRTTLVKHAFELLYPSEKTRLLCFSDDMDGLRKVPTNVPQQDMLKQYLNKPLTRVPDPFNKFDSFAAHNNAMLCSFLDNFGFSYEFASSTDYYTNGQFNTALQRVLECHKEIQDVIIPTLGEERAATYSPFLPIDPESGDVLQVTITATDPTNGTISYRRNDGKDVTIPVTDANCKLQWKADWAMRWYALDVDYEMSGKDLIDSVQLGSRICKILGGVPPVNLTYEHFVDENGAKISKSKGNGLTIEEWLRYAPAESLSLYMYRTPTRAKKLYRSLIPTVVEEYAELLDAYPNQTPAEQLENPVWHIHGGNVPPNPLPFAYSMLLNLIAVTAADTPDLVWRTVQRYRPELTPKTAPQLHTLIQGALAYYADTIKPTQQYRSLQNDMERSVLADIDAYLKGLNGSEDAETIQTEFYEIGKRHFGKEKLRDYFKLLYQSLLGFDNGPRLGTFTLIYGVNETRELIATAMNRA